MSIGILLLYFFKCFIRCLRVKVQLCTSFAYCRNGYKDHVMESFDESCVEGSVDPGSKDAILTDCAPGKEEGIESLRSFPDRQHQPPVAAASSRRLFTDEGFDIDTLATIREDSESPQFDLSALMGA